MKFAYREYISSIPGSTDFRLILRPVITIRIFGTQSEAQWDALVDTGADETLLPITLAGLLGVELDSEAAGSAVGITGERLAIYYGDVQLQVTAGQDTVAWNTTVGFVDFGASEDEVIVLGHGGCLDYFTAKFDGEQAVLELTPNQLLPSP